MPISRLSDFFLDIVYQAQAIYFVTSLLWGNESHGLTKAILGLLSVSRYSF